jgi:hypothetical protein
LKKRGKTNMSGALAVRTGTFSKGLLEKLKRRECEIDAGDALVWNADSNETQTSGSNTKEQVVQTDTRKKRRVA